MYEQKEKTISRISNAGILKGGTHTQRHIHLPPDTSINLSKKKYSTTLLFGVFP